jgi:hypothetical protein
MKYKLEVIHDRIRNLYECNVYEWKRKHWWSKDKSWVFVEGHTIGKKYKCPEVIYGLKTVEDLFNESLKEVEERYYFSETHNTTIQL